MKSLISIGECMLELSSVKDDIWKMGIAGDTLNTSWYARACLSKNWSVLFATKIGKDVMSSKVINFLIKMTLVLTEFIITPHELLDFMPSN